MSLGLNHSHSATRTHSHSPTRTHSFHCLLSHRSVSLLQLTSTLLCSAAHVNDTPSGSDEFIMFVSKLGHVTCNDDDIRCLRRQGVAGYPPECRELVYLELSGGAQRERGGGASERETGGCEREIRACGTR